MEYQTIARKLTRELVMMRLSEPVGVAEVDEDDAPEYDEAIARRVLEVSGIA